MHVCVMTLLQTENYLSSIPGVKAGAETLNQRGLKAVSLVEHSMDHRQQVVGIGNENNQLWHQ